MTGAGDLRWVWLPPATRLGELRGSLSPRADAVPPCPRQFPAARSSQEVPGSSWSWGGLPSTRPLLVEGQGANPCPL